MYSQIVLAHAEGDTNEDGLLEAWEIMNLELKADLVVLSACETARGRVGAGEGMIGLSWALFVAGCPTTVVSQWKVESASTTELMVAFHQNLKAGNRGLRMAKAEALRQAALRVMKMNAYRHPFYWAAFVVIGDGS
jgi:CHAT domain-containing protein